MKHYCDINGFGVGYPCHWLLYVSVKIVITFAVECCKVPLSMTQWYRSGHDVIWRSDIKVMYECTEIHLSALLETQLRRIPIKPFEWTNSIIWFWSTKENGLLDISHREQLICVCLNLGQHRFWVRFNLVIFSEYIFFLLHQALLSTIDQIFILQWITTDRQHSFPEAMSAKVLWHVSIGSRKLCRCVSWNERFVMGYTLNPGIRGIHVGISPIMYCNAAVSVDFAIQ